MEEFTATIVNWLQANLGNPYVTVFFISMIPMIEVRGAIPIAMQLGISPAVSYVFSAVSALAICPILVFGLAPVLRAMKRTKWFRKFASVLEDTFRGKAENIEKKADDPQKSRKILLRKILGLFAFVAIPLPMTGVWTGSAVAAFLDLKPYYSIPTIVVGNFCAAGIIALLSYLLGDKSFIILIVLAVFVLVSIASILATMFLKAKKQKGETTEASPDETAEENTEK